MTSGTASVPSSRAVNLRRNRSMRNDPHSEAPPTKSGQYLPQFTLKKKAVIAGAKDPDSAQVSPDAAL
jgi:hypothetical protein